MRQPAVVFLSTLLISGCGIFYKQQLDVPPIDNLSAEERQSRLKSITHWGLKGRISIRAEEDGASASIIWNQQGDASEIRLFGVFGIGAVRVELDADNATLFRGGEKPLHGDSAEKLLLWELGLRVPLDSLKDWLRGIEGKGYAAAYDNFGRLQSLRYTDASRVTWLATFDAYRQVKGNQLPVRMTVEGGGVSIKLKTDSWNTEKPVENKSQRLKIPGVSSLKAFLYS